MRAVATTFTSIACHLSLISVACMQKVQIIACNAFVCPVPTALPVIGCQSTSVRMPHIPKQSSVRFSLTGQRLQKKKKTGKNEICWGESSTHFV